MLNAFLVRFVKLVFFFMLFVPLVCPEERFVDFVKGMAPSRNFKLTLLEKERWWKKAYDLYNGHIINGEKSAHARIPFILHHVWLGSRLPDASIEFRKGWDRHNPTWTFVLWTDNESNFVFGKVVSTYRDLWQLLEEKREKYIVFDIRNKGLINEQAYVATDNYGEKSDILRYELLYEFGGLYVDTDFECLKSFDVFHYLCDFYTGISYSDDFAFLNGLIGSAPKSLIMKYCIDDLKECVGATQFMEIIYRTGPRHLTRSFFKALDSGYSGIAVGFPSTTFYPLPNWLRHVRDISVIKSWVRPESFALHYWYMTWWQKVKQNFVGEW